MKFGSDATVVGGISNDILSRTITVALGRNRHDKDWRNNTGSVGQLLEYLGTFQRGDKDGACILQGELVGNQRVAKSVAKNHLLIIDIDTGMSVDEVGKIVFDKGLFAVIWTTHSFGKATTEIAEEHFLRWCKKNGRPVPTAGDELTQALGLYLEIDKRYRSSVFETFTYEGRKLVEGGMKYIVRHAPMPKLRVLFLLDKPFDFTEGSSQKTRIDEWKKAYVNASEWLGVAYDSSCVDPSRLMYTPRIPVDATVGEGTNEILILPGECLAIDAFQDSGFQDRTFQDRTFQNNAFDVIGNMMHILDEEGVEANGVERPNHVFKTPGLLKFVRNHKDFDIVGFLEAVAPDDKRGGDGGGDGDKVDWACPNEESHTTMNAQDRAFMASTNGETWYAGCLHDGCKHASGEDRVWYLDMLCQKYDITNASELEAWSGTAQQQQLDASAQVEATAAGDYVAAIEALTESSPASAITAVLKMMAPLTDPIEIDTQLAEVRRRTKGKVTVPRLRVSLKGYAAAHNAAIGTAAPAEPVDPRKPEPDNPNDAKEVWDHWSFDKRFYATRAILRRENEKEPRLFKTQSGRLIYVQSTDLGAKMIDAELNIVTWHTIGRVKYKHMDRLTGEVAEERVPKDLIDTLLGDLDAEWPLLTRIANVPIVTENGTQAYKRGYIPEINLYLDPPGDFLPLPDVVTDADVEEAYATILECIRDFPFCDYSTQDVDDGKDHLRDGTDAAKPIMSDILDDDGHPWPNLDRGRASRANAIAMIIEPFARHLINGACPMYFIDKPAPGSGAGYLADVAFYATQGSRAVAQMMSDSNEEFRKAITASLREGSPIVFIDNVNRKVDSGPLAAAITNGTWQDRILGESVVTKIKIENTWMIAGNNAKFTPENMRRLVPIKLDARVPNPAFDRPKAAFKHNPLQDYLETQRPNIIRAINILIKNWVDKGMPRSDLTFNSFDNYVAVMGGILESAGITGFLGNIREFNKIKNTDDDSKNEYGRLMFERYKFSHFTKMEALIALKGVGFGDTIELPIKTDKDDGVMATNLRAWMMDHMDGNVFYLDPEKTKLVALNAHRTNKNRTGWQFVPVKGFEKTE